MYKIAYIKWCKKISQKSTKTSSLFERVAYSTIVYYNLFTCHIPTINSLKFIHRVTILFSFINSHIKHNNTHNEFERISHHFKYLTCYNSIKSAEHTLSPSQFMFVCIYFYCIIIKIFILKLNIVFFLTKIQVHFSWNLAQLKDINATMSLNVNQHQRSAAPSKQVQYSICLL